MPASIRLLLSLCVLTCLSPGLWLACGCGTEGQTEWFGKDEGKDVSPAEPVLHEEDPREKSAALRDTIGQYAWIEGLRRLSVGGYGLVVGLGENGTRQCPRPIREQMLQEMRRRYRLGSDAESMKHLKPDNLLDSKATAVVLVYGEIPAAAHKGTVFDLTVRTLEGTDVTSLEGGWLMPCTLQLWANNQPVEGRVLGEGGGQVFINPFGLKEGAATKTNPREGRVIGGGKTFKDRRLRLVLTDPSAAIATRLMHLVNRQFGVEPRKTADALSPHAIDLHVPKAWWDREPHFLDLITHLFVPSTPSFHDLRLRELCEEAVQPDAPLNDISLALEGMGRTAVPTYRKLYAHEDRGVSYFVGRAGLRVGDDLAIDVLARHANDPESPYRELAVEEMGLAKEQTRIVLALRPLLDDADQKVRQLAYEALRQQRDPSIRSYRVGKDGGFLLDVVPSKSNYLITASRAGRQQIVLFGNGMRCQTPVYYFHRTDLVTITADRNAAKLRLVRKIPSTGTVSTPIRSSTEVAELIARLGREPTKDADGNYCGLGLTYSQIVEVLHDLCEDKAIDATFVLRGDEVAQITPKLKGVDRPESEL